MDERKIIILRFEGLFQSWGCTSKWDDRTTEKFPTKSGVVGLLGSALGIERGDPELSLLNDAVHIAVRADRPGSIIIDYQTVMGEPLRNADGKIRRDPIVSKRSYLQDACFTVFLEVRIEWHTRIVNALKNPKWSLFLGRKSCIPSRPILECADSDYSDLNEALRNYPLQRRDEKDIFPIMYVTDQRDDNLSSIAIADDMKDGNRSFVLRRIWIGSIEKESVPCI